MTLSQEDAKLIEFFARESDVPQLVRGVCVATLGVIEVLLVLVNQGAAVSIAQLRENLVERDNIRTKQLEVMREAAIEETARTKDRVAVVQEKIEEHNPSEPLTTEETKELVPDELSAPPKDQALEELEEALRLFRMDGGQLAVDPEQLEETKQALWDLLAELEGGPAEQSDAKAAARSTDDPAEDVSDAAS